MLNVGVIGVGVIGRTLLNASKHAGFNTLGFDPFIPEFGDISVRVLECDIVFVSVPTLTVLGVQQLAPLKDVCEKLKKLKYKGVVCIRCTTLPGTCTDLVAKYKLRIVHMPEFLTEANAAEDFLNQSSLFVSGKPKDRAVTLEAMFGILPHPHKGWRVFQTDDHRVTEFQKYFANCHKAIKVAFCNEIYAACQAVKVDYEQVRKFAIEVPGVGDNHTKVPNGGMLGFGGMCFPKDMSAFANYLDLIKTDAQIFHAALAANELARAPL